MEKLKFEQLHPDAILPTRGSDEACGLDIYSIEHVTVARFARVAVRTGFAVEIPSGFYGRIAPRSGLALKMGIDVLGGVIDSDYRGEVRCLLVNLGDLELQISAGERIAQLIVENVAILTPEWTDQLKLTARNSDGFGSTGS